MGKIQRIRELQYSERIQPFRDYMNAYLHCVRMILSQLSEGERNVINDSPFCTGRCVLFPCRDGVIILLYKGDDISVQIAPASDRPASELTAHGTDFSLYDSTGTRMGSPQPCGFGFSIIPASVIVWWRPSIMLGREYRPLYDKMWLHSWDAKLKNPDEEALKEIQGALSSVNISKNDMSDQKDKPANDRCRALLNEYRILLESSHREEELQIFLQNHPEMIVLDHMECYPKHKLGAEYVTDFVFSQIEQTSRRYWFVEIEKPSKELFTQAGQFSSDFTQAKDQLLSWDCWVENNIAYAREKLPGLFKPSFLLIMGRNNQRTIENEAKLRAEFANTNRFFLTYDDIADRFERALENLATYIH